MGVTAAKKAGDAQRVPGFQRALRGVSSEKDERQKRLYRKRGEVVLTNRKVLRRNILLKIIKLNKSCDYKKYIGKTNENAL